MEQIKAVIEGRDELSFSDSSGVQAIGCTDLMTQIQARIKGEGQNPKDWKLPTGKTHVDLLIKELILKARGEFKLPYAEDELCHCRGIKTDQVLQAIKAGAHTIEKIRATTDANTACGTCAPDCESLIFFLTNNPA